MKMPLSDNFESSKNSRLAYSILYPILFILSEIYLIIIKIRHFLYDNNTLFFKREEVEALVISVGNISAGGTGKTPIVIEIAKYLSKIGKKCSVISRGYKRESTGQIIVSNGEGSIVSDSPKVSGDEPLIIAKSTGVPVICNSNRTEGSNYAIEKFNSNYIVLDDGFQHRKLQKDFDIIVIDSSRFLGNEKTLPLGILRDDILRLKKANRIIISKVFEKEKFIKQADYLVNRLKINRKNIVSSKLKAEILSNFKNNYNTTILEDKKIYAFCGLGNPQDFFKTLENLKNKNNKDTIKLELQGKQQFPDHYKYTLNDLENIVNNAIELNSYYIITTEKDFINFPKEFIEKLPSNILFLKIESEFYDNEFENKIGIEKIIGL